VHLEKKVRRSQMAKEKKAMLAAFKMDKMMSMAE
jgi:hypothetical protein